MNEAMMRGRPKAPLVLSASEREQLTALTMRRKTAQALPLRARIVLACAEGIDNKTVATKQRVTTHTVSKWRSRFINHRVDGLLDAPRPGAPRTIEDTQVEAVVARTLESVPTGATHWSTRTMAREMGMSQTAVSRIWRAFGLQPHRQETPLSSPPIHFFVDKVRLIVDDDEPVRLAMETLVRSFGRRTRLFASAEEFLQSGSVAETSCLISDVMMTGMSGVKMHDQILALGYAPPTIFFTAFPSAELRAKALANGALPVLNKPVDADAIGHWLSVALDRP